MTVRKNVNLSKTLALWIEEKSEETGISQSSLIAMSVDAYRKEEQAIYAMQPLLQAMEELKTLGLMKGDDEPDTK